MELINGMGPNWFRFYNVQQRESVIDWIQKYTMHYDLRLLPT